ncbi:hypothetical protein ACFQ10_37400 [Streptomyces indonesiensis]
MSAPEDITAPDDVSAPAPSRGRRLDIPQGGPLDGAGQPGGARAAREARAHLHIAYGPARMCADPAPYPLPEGPVPREELARLRRLHRAVPEHAAMRDQLRRTHLLALCGEPGTGRAWTGLALLAELAELTGGGVSRLGYTGPDGAPGVEKGVEKTERGHGYLLELPADQAESTAEPLLDRLRAHFAAHEAFCVVLVAGGPAADRLLRGRRHAMAYRPPAAADVLDRHLTELLADRPAGLLETARATARRPELTEALGLDEPRPGEAARLAGQLAAHAEGRCPTSGCWSTAGRSPRIRPGSGSSRPGTPAPCPPRSPRCAPPRCGSRWPSSTVRRTASWRRPPSCWPGNWPSRSIRSTRPAARCSPPAPGPASPRRARSTARGWRTSGTPRCPCARCGSRGGGWRPPCSTSPGTVTTTSAARWPVGCARCATTRAPRCGCARRSPRACCAPATISTAWSSWRCRWPAPTARCSGWPRPPRSPRRPAPRRCAPPCTGCCTHGRAATTNGSARPPRSPTATAWRRARSRRPWRNSAELARADDGRTTSHSVVRLLAGAEPETVLAALTHWLRDTRRARRDLALLATLRAVTTRTSHLWGLGEVPELEPYAAWPLATGLLAARPECGPRLAELLRAALTWARSAGAAEDALVGWIRRAAGDARQLAVLCDFLPRLAQDGDEPLDAGAATRIREVLEAL